MICYKTKKERLFLILFFFHFFSFLYGRVPPPFGSILEKCVDGEIFWNFQKKCQKWPVQESSNIARNKLIIDQLLLGTLRWSAKDKQPSQPPCPFINMLCIAFRDQGSHTECSQRLIIDCSILFLKWTRNYSNTVRLQATLSLGILKHSVAQNSVTGGLYVFSEG